MEVDLGPKADTKAGEKGNLMNSSGDEVAAGGSGGRQGWWCSWGSLYSVVEAGGLALRVNKQKQSGIEWREDQCS